MGRVLIKAGAGTLYLPPTFAFTFVITVTVAVTATLTYLKELELLKFSVYR